MSMLTAETEYWHCVLKKIYFHMCCFEQVSNAIIIKDMFKSSMVYYSKAENYDYVRYKSNKDAYEIFERYIVK